MAQIVERQDVDRRKHLCFQKVGIFIDAENIELSGLKHHEKRTDYKKILDKVGDREIIRILYYKPQYKEISPDFANFWHSIGGELRRPQKNADSFLIIDAVTMAEKMDIAIILGGDKDFLPLIWYLKSRGCGVEIWSWPEATSPEVQHAADFYYPLNQLFVLDSVTKAESRDSQAQSSREVREVKETRDTRDNRPPKDGKSEGREFKGNRDVRKEEPASQNRDFKGNRPQRGNAHVHKDKQDRRGPAAETGRNETSGREAVTGIRPRGPRRKEE